MTDNEWFHAGNEWIITSFIAWHTREHDRVFSAFSHYHSKGAKMRSQCETQIIYKSQKLHKLLVDWMSASRRRNKEPQKEKVTLIGLVL